MKYLIVIALLIPGAIGLAQTKDCAKFREGKFLLVDEELGNTSIIRKGNQQVEISDNSSLEIRFNVEWINDCTYTLKIDEIVNNPNKIALPMNMILTVEIIETKDKSYIQRSTSDLFPDAYESEILLVE